MRPKKIMSALVAGAMAASLAGVVPNAVYADEENILLTAETNAKGNESGNEAEGTAEREFLYGDVNNDGIADLKDYYEFAKYLFLPEKFHIDNEEAADVYKDGVIDIKDDIILLEHNLDTIKQEDLGKEHPKADPASVVSPIGVKMYTEKTEFTREELKDGAEVTVYVDVTGSASEDDCIRGISFDLSTAEDSGIEPLDVIFSDPNALGTKRGGDIRSEMAICSFESYTMSSWDDAEKPNKCGYSISDYKNLSSYEKYSGYQPARVSYMTDSGCKAFRTDESFGEHLAQFKVKLPSDLAAGDHTISFDNAKTIICLDNDITGNSGIVITDLPAAEGVTFTVKDTAPEKVSSVAADDEGNVSWEAAENAAYYKVVKVVNGVYYVSGKITDTSYKLVKVPSSNYKVYVLAYSADGKKSTSKGVNVKVEASLGFVNDASVDENGNVTWSAADNAQAYRVVKVVNGRRYYGLKVTDTSYQLKSVPSKDYYVYVLAYGAGSALTSGKRIKAEVGTLGTVLDPKVDKDGKVTWSAVRNAVKYRIGKTVNGKTVYSGDITDTSYTFKNKATKDYKVFIVAYDENGNKTFGTKKDVKVQ